MYAIHDSFDEKFRKPFGAAEVGSAVSLSLFSTERATASLLYWIDGKKHEADMVCTPYTHCDTCGFMYSAALNMPSEPGLLWYSFCLRCKDKTLYYCGSHGTGFLSDSITRSYQITVYKPFELPSWYKNAIVYQIFPDRFARSKPYGGLLRTFSHTNKGQAIYVHTDWNEEVNYLPMPHQKYYEPCDFFCGDLQGIEENIDYLREFNISCIYLNPIFASPSNHRYDTSDYMQVDAILGGDGAYFSLKSALEKAGIHIMLDGVFSHTGADSIYFNKYKHFDSLGAFNSTRSEFFSWYDFIDYPTVYKSWWGFPELPETDEDNISFREHIKQAVQKWDCSWRLDVADELTDGFMRFFLAEVRAKNKDAVVIGEVWEDASDKFSKGKRRGYTDGDMLCGVMNYPLRQWIIDFLLYRITGRDFAFFVKVQKENYPREFLNGCLNMLSSHDTVRILSVLCGAPERDEISAIEQQKVLFCGNELTKGEKKVILAIVIQFALLGVPCIYYGDEQGMQGMADPFCRRTFTKNEKGYIAQKVKRICKARATHKAFMGDSFITAYTDDVIILERQNDGAHVICIVNRGDHGLQIKLPAENSIYRDVLSGSVYTVNCGHIEVYSEPLSALMLCSL